jgi:hypothetical protein
MFNFLKYLSLGSAVFTTVQALVALVKLPGPLSDSRLLWTVQPAIEAVTSVFPSVKITPELAIQVCSAVAGAVNKFYKKGA